MIDAQLVRVFRDGDPLARRELAAAISQLTAHVDVVLYRLSRNAVEAIDIEAFVQSVKPTTTEIARHEQRARTILG